MSRSHSKMNWPGCDVYTLHYYWGHWRGIWRANPSNIEAADILESLDAEIERRYPGFYKAKNA